MRAAKDHSHFVVGLIPLRERYREIQRPEVCVLPDRGFCAGWRATRGRIRTVWCVVWTAMIFSPKGPEIISQHVPLKSGSTSSEELPLQYRKEAITPSVCICIVLLRLQPRLIGPTNSRFLLYLQADDVAAASAMVRRPRRS